jgi:acyl-CoA dehydrogenase
VKLFCTEAVGRIADRAVQILGGMGYMREGPVEAIFREVRGMRIYEGTSEVQRMIIARDLLQNGLKSIHCD